MVEDHAELVQIAAAVAELLGEREIVNVGIVLAEQRFGVGDQRIKVRLRFAFGGRRALE